MVNSYISLRPAIEDAIERRMKGLEDYEKKYEPLYSKENNKNYEERT